MKRQQPLEQIRIACQRSQGTIPQPVISVQHQHRAAHQRRSGGQSTMGRLIATEIFGGNGIRQCSGLMKTQAQAFAGDGVYAPGSVADQRDSPAIDFLQLPAYGHGSAFGANHRHSIQAICEFRAFHPQAVQAYVLVA